MQEIYRILARLMGTDLTVLINGESGTGKELAARALHDYGKRKHAPFVAINMAAIPHDLIESELFGHKIEIETKNKKAGKVSITYKTLDELDNIINKIKNK